MFKPELVAVIFGCLGVGVCGAFVWRSFKVRRWPQAEATIVRKWVELNTTTSVGRTTVSFRYEAKVEYVFSVHGVNYRGDRLSEGPTLASEANRERALEAIGPTHPVYYHPENPAESVLSPYPWWPAVLGLVFAIPFTIVSIGLWLS